jgi:23S rRNA (guanine745-N1)-methyltransferase
MNRVEQRLVCSRNHSFDRAKEGYFNLLLSVGGIHGDNKEMVEARRAFLEGGYYSPLATAVTELVLKYTDKHGQILDAGCGE